MHSQGFVAVFRYPDGNSVGNIYICPTGNVDQESSIPPQMLCVQELHTGEGDNEQDGKSEIVISAVLSVPSAETGRTYDICFWSTEDRDDAETKEERRWTTVFINHYKREQLPFFEGESPTVLHPLDAFSGFDENGEESACQVLICGSFGRMFRAEKYLDEGVSEIDIVGCYSDPKERHRMSSNDVYNMITNWGSKVSSWLSSSSDGLFVHFEAGDGDGNKEQFRNRRGYAIAEGGVVDLQELHVGSDSDHCDILILTPSAILLYQVSADLEMTSRAYVQLPISVDNAYRFPISLAIAILPDAIDNTRLLRFSVLFYNKEENKYSVDFYGLSTEESFATDHSLSLKGRVELPNRVDRSALDEMLLDGNTTDLQQCIELGAPSRFLQRHVNESLTKPVQYYFADRDRVAVLWPPVSSGHVNTDYSLNFCLLAYIQLDSNISWEAIPLKLPNIEQNYSDPNVHYVGFAEDVQRNGAVLFGKQYALMIDMMDFDNEETMQPASSTPRLSEEQPSDQPHKSYPFLKALPTVTVTSFMRIIQKYVLENTDFDKHVPGKEGMIPSSDQLAKSLSIAIRSLFDDGVCRLTAFSEAGTYPLTLPMPQHITDKVEEALAPLYNQVPLIKRADICVDAAIEQISEHIMDQRPQPRTKATPDNYPWDMVNTKIIKHLLLVVLLQRTGLLNRLSRRVRRILCDHGSRLSSAVALAALCQRCMTMFEEDRDNSRNMAIDMDEKNEESGQLPKHVAESEEGITEHRLQLSDCQLREVFGKPWSREVRHCESVARVIEHTIQQVTRQNISNVHDISRANLSEWHVAYSTLTRMERILQSLARSVRILSSDLQAKLTLQQLRDAAIDSMLACVLAAHFHVKTWHSFYSLPLSTEEHSSIDLHSWIENDPRSITACTEAADAVAGNAILIIEKRAEHQQPLSDNVLHSLELGLRSVLPLESVGLVETKTAADVSRSWQSLTGFVEGLLNNFDFIPPDIRPIGAKVVRQSLALSLQAPVSETRYILRIAAIMLRQGPACTASVLEKRVTPKVDEASEVFGWLSNQENCKPLTLGDILYTDAPDVPLYPSPATKRISAQKGIQACQPLINAISRLDIRSILCILSCKKELSHIEPFFRLSDSLHFSNTDFSGNFVKYLFRLPSETFRAQTSCQSPWNFPNSHLSAIFVFATDVFSVQFGCVKNESSYLGSNNAWNSIFNALLRQQRDDVLAMLLLRLCTTKSIWRSGKEENRLLEKARLRLCNICSTALCSISLNKQTNSPEQLVAKSRLFHSQDESGRQFSHTTVPASLGKLTSLLVLKSDTHDEKADYRTLLEEAQKNLRKCNCEIWLFVWTCRLLNDMSLFMNSRNLEIDVSQINTLESPDSAVSWCLEEITRLRSDPADAGHLLGQAAHIVYMWTKLEQAQTENAPDTDSKDDSFYRRYSSDSARLADGDLSVLNFTSQNETHLGLETPNRRGQSFSSSELFVLVVYSALIVDVDALLMAARQMEDQNTAPANYREVPIALVKCYETLQTLLVGEQNPPDARGLLTNSQLVDIALGRFTNDAIHRGYSAQEVPALIPSVKSIVLDSLRPSGKV